MQTNQSRAHTSTTFLIRHSHQSLVLITLGPSTTQVGTTPKYLGPTEIIKTSQSWTCLLCLTFPSRGNHNRHSCPRFPSLPLPLDRPGASNCVAPMVWHGGPPSSETCEYHNHLFNVYCLSPVSVGWTSSFLLLHYIFKQRPYQENFKIFSYSQLISLKSEAIPTLFTIASSSALSVAIIMIRYRYPSIAYLMWYSFVLSDFYLGVFCLWSVQTAPQPTASPDPLSQVQACYFLFTLISFNLSLHTALLVLVTRAPPPWSLYQIVRPLKEITALQTPLYSCLLAQCLRGGAP